MIVSAMRNACHHNLYALANSSAMNGVGPATVVKLTQPMVITIVQILACAASFFLVLGAFLWSAGVRRLRKTEQYQAYKRFKQGGEGA